MLSLWTTICPFEQIVARKVCRGSGFPSLPRCTNQALSALDLGHCRLPGGAFYAYPNVTEAMRMRDIGDCETFRQRVLADTGVSFCTHLHFGTPPPGQAESYIRLAYSGIGLDQIEEGLRRFKGFVEA